MASKKHRQHGSPKRDPRRVKLDTVVTEIFTSNTAHSYSFIAATERFLRQFHLSPQVEPSDILHEAYMRAIAFLERGGVINDERAWLKTTTFNIVRERSRKHQKECACDPQSALFEMRVSDERHVEQDAIEQRIKILWQALETLRANYPGLAELMNWHLLEKLKWDEIQQRLQQRGEEIDVQTLRQRGTRAKKQLRKIYHQLEKGEEVSARRS